MNKSGSATRMPDDFPAEFLEDFSDMPNYYNWIVGSFASELQGNTAEIGAGLGTISELLLDHVDRLDLVEPSAFLTGLLEDKFGGDGRCRIIPQAIEDWIAQVPSGDLDSIVMVNVLEHIEDDRAAARGLFEALKPGGKLFVFVPSLPFLYSELDRKYGHYRRYSRRTLRNCIEGAGFRIRTLRFFDLAGVLPWWLINTILGKTTLHQPSLTIYDRLIVPPTRFLESLLPPPIGKNLILVACKD